MKLVFQILNGDQISYVEINFRVDTFSRMQILPYFPRFYFRWLWNFNNIA